MKTLLFKPLTIKDITFRNRVFVSPMCQYSAVEGIPNDWHLVHLGSRAVGGAGLVMAEATAVNPTGRISHADLGLWNDLQLKEFKRITHFIKSQGAVPAIQLAHAGRKSSTDVTWRGGNILPKDQGGWDVVAPSAIAYSNRYLTPRALNHEEIESLIQDFAEATKRSLTAGFEVIEIHMAHGYLLHEFLSPLSNQRTDEYGGNLENRMRFPQEVMQAVRKVWPMHLPLFVRISATDWSPGGWDIEESVVLTQKLKDIGVDLIDVSSGGNVPAQNISVGPHYQVPFAQEIKTRANILTGAVGLITDPHEANGILEKNEADVVFLARELLRDPYWPLHAAKALGEVPIVPNQYLRAF